MNHESIIAEWKKDSEIDETELGKASLDTSKLHQKYLTLYTNEKVKMLKLKSNVYKVKKVLTEYYLGELDNDELAEIGRDQFYKKILKNELETYILADELFIETKFKADIQSEKVDYLESVLKQLNNRGFQIKNAVDWTKFCSGG